MRRCQVIVELSAQQDISDACIWLAERDRDAAKRWFDGIYRKIASLEIFPERCPRAPESKNVGMEIRETFHGGRRHKYRILFAVTGDKVHVLHVRHGARLPLG